MDREERWRAAFLCEAMAKAIMVQGTMSNVGKSLLTAALCRILYQDGYRAAPFKSQNMALNSFVTREGLEMGRAQVMQAEAAGTEPAAAMNPILLKPDSDTGSQVIVNGEVLGNMSAKDYFTYKKKLLPEIEKAYRKLEESYEVIVIEGAGSPAEINLKENDIVNMGMAELADASVLLVGDIDRGGVFAQLYGTVMLLTEEERSRIKGLVLNKFRGDKAILEPGIRMLEELCGIPVVGILPYMDVDLEEEDSLAVRLSRKPSAGVVDIAVIRLPKLSNFTDFQVFELLSGVSLRYVGKPEELGKPDMIILPGTKSTMEDMRWLRESGMEAAMLKCHNAGCVLFGICGGYQMLGEALTEGEESSLRGMALLPTETVFSQRKTRTRVKGKIGNIGGKLSPLSGMEIEGYEIHMGESRRIEKSEVSDGKGRRTSENSGMPEKNGPEENFVAVVTDSVSGEAKQEGFFRDNIYGTYIHGFFDAPGVAEGCACALAKAAGKTLEIMEELDYAAYKEEQFELLAKTVRAHMDMERIYRILEGKESGRDIKSEEGIDGNETGRSKKEF